MVSALSVQLLKHLPLFPESTVFNSLKNSQPFSSFFTFKLIIINNFVTPQFQKAFLLIPSYKQVI